MERCDLDYFREWFKSYTESFYTGNEEDRKNISLKVNHTYNVCRRILDIARDEPLDENRILIAEAVALFHDIGRFPQYAQFKTFRDSVSVNHGKLGAEILIEKKLLANIPEEQRRVIISAVRFHNAYRLPELDDAEGVLFLKLVRDADKIDIWRIFLELCESGGGDWKSVAGLGLPDLPGYSKEIVSAILEQRAASLSSMRSLNDFLLLQLSWIYDLNFSTSARILLGNACISRFMRHLPRTEEMGRISRLLHEYATLRSKEIRPSSSA